MTRNHLLQLARAVAISAAAMTCAAATADAPASAQRLNPIISLLEQKQPVMGLYAPSNRRPGGNAAAEATKPKTPTELARETVAYKLSDFVFDGTMEHKYDETYPVFAAYAKALGKENHLSKKPHPHISYPMVVKMHEIAPDPVLAAKHISEQLDLGVSGIMFVQVESAEELSQGIAAMRYPANGGIRRDSVGSAPAYWGVSKKDYRRKADVWPLNPNGELINWVVIESKDGLQNVREIAAVKGLGVLIPGIGTLRGVFSTTDASGKRTVDEAAWENAIQQVLSACKEFNVPCGIPATAEQIELRMQQGFSVFIMNWGDAGFKTIDVGRKASGRPLPN
ncbi:aldolase/citrate lyase family protein [Povalibacter sp.]|uniref:aldolase/citrate lyase family protein n=1 Tax=Povalibacter sp. TaxID=1962978 RepID=UPI002F3EF32E